ncbi:hypothetical protein [Lysinibacillus sp. BW-2-10]|uniref:hypothetical protein n=1 Tax=Lysinibacillus sp. BW-2-10 TaxID=2590030 RepID=UPI00117C6934|nr:hypothetical protein [Lysinibacillus sp. BW-2-10]TSI03362.1 hypothetical protein FJQ64_17850 [Lysinibacillus sp. BW-2-10]
MRKFRALLFPFVSILFLVGCSNQFGDLKEAVSGIDSAAQKAATATSLDVHQIRSIEIDYENEVFTINDLFKTILRDVQWDYENLNNIHNFTVKGTWKDNLFEHYQFTDEVKNQLVKNGKVVIHFQIVDQQILADSTTVQMTLNNELLVDEMGKEALHSLFSYYINL